MPRRIYTRNCQRCGVLMENVGPSRVYCDKCGRQVRNEQNQASVKKRTEMRKREEAKRKNDTDRINAMLRHFQKYGYFSYGKGRAAMENGLIPMFDDKCLLPNQKVEKEEQVQILHIFTCHYCGKEFESEDARRRKYCSEECGYRAYLERNRRYKEERNAKAKCDSGKDRAKVSGNVSADAEVGNG